MQIRKADGSGGALADVQMSYERGGEAQIGPQGVPGCVYITDPPSGGVIVSLRDSNGAVFFSATVTSDNPYGLDDMSCDLVDGPLYVTTNAACGEIFVYVKE